MEPATTRPTPVAAPAGGSAESKGDRVARTDRDRPYWVKILEHPLEVHNHENGICDIAGMQPTRENIGWRGGRCYYDGDWGNPEVGLWCGCPYCRGALWSSDRQGRQAKKRQLRDWWARVLTAKGELESELPLRATRPVGREGLEPPADGL